MTIQPIPGAGPDPRDQPQRSMLAWRRTVLALAGVGLVLAKVSLSVQQPVAVVATVVALACVAAAFVMSLISSERRLGMPHSALASPSSAFVPLLLATVAVSAMAVAAGLVVLTA